MQNFRFRINGSKSYLNSMSEQTAQVPPVAVGENGNGENNSKNPKSANRQGKASRNKNQDAFRRRKGAQEMDALKKRIESNFSIFSKDSDEQLNAAVNAVQLTPQKRAVPLEVTRGVGFATAICYERTCTTWSLEALSDIITVHQVYRVHLLLVHLKVYLAQQLQCEPVTTDGALTRLILADELREMLLTITRVPSIIAGILDCVGKFTVNDKPFHMGYTTSSPTSGADIACTLNPGNIRQILGVLAQPGAQFAADFVAHNPIPGALFTADPADMNRLANLDQVWPDGNALIANDLHCYKNWITRVENRLPKHSFADITWSGTGNGSGLWSTEVSSLKLASTFTVSRARSTGARRVRGPDGRYSQIPAESQPATAVYSGFNIESSRTEFWTRESTSHTHAVIGISSLTGEVIASSTRYAINAVEFATLCMNHQICTHLNMTSLKLIGKFDLL